MKTIVCYGDSNTWGFMPKYEEPKVTAENRYPWGVRWTSRMQMQLGEGYHVAEAGLNGRTTMFDCRLDEHRNGLSDVDTCMLQQFPVDLVILMLGTNDVKDFFCVTPYMIAHGALRLIERIRSGGYGPGGNSPEILLVSPIRLHPDMEKRWLGEEFGPGAIARNDQLPAYYEKVAAEKGVHFLNAAASVTADAADSIHMNEAGHAATAELMYEQVRRILG